jgi:hypothetical protein
MADKCNAGGRRRHTKKSKKHSRRRHTRRGGAALASYNGPVLGQGGQPAGASFSAVGVSGATPNTNASNYGGAPSTSTGYSGGRRSRRGRKSHRRSRHRMRGGNASAPMGGEGKGGGVATSFVGDIGGANWPIAGRDGVSTRTV